MHNKKKAISTVVATVLIILITVAAVTIIWTAIIPMIRENLEGGASCLNAVSQITINGAFTCLNDKAINLQIKRGAKDFNLADIQVLVTKADGDTVSSYLIDQEDKLWGTNTLDNLPGMNEERVFASNPGVMNFTGASKVSIAPLVSIGATKTTCEISSSFDLIPCS